MPTPRRPATLVPERPATDPGGDFGNVRGALRRIAEGLLDLGVDDARLVSGVAALRDHEQALASLEAAQETRY